jgi:hypothetical protein
MRQGMIRVVLLGVAVLGFCGCLATLQGSQVATPSSYDQRSSPYDILTPQFLGIGLNMSTP